MEEDLEAFLARAGAADWSAVALVARGSYSLSELVSQGWARNEMFRTCSAIVSVEPIVSLLRGLPGLRRLALIGVRLNAEGAKAIASGLGQLTTLNLCHNGVGDEGAKAIASGLGQLTTLDLEANGVGDEGAMAIASGLGQLTTLNLSETDVSAEGAKAIASVMGPGTTTLDCDGIAGHVLEFTRRPY